ncbi:hypothetical protein BKP37_15415 [Anaerobacillus alkalilacustris]|uniref:histidine kinase n=2 Tax=Anaerobacillus alkalilacustris TaxID=393763 RepID=A0A1S2LH56_9BACI|nr:hypothetical protein BKP37_15415 [Anaerobacillus alkalilacustris]
MNIHRQIMVIIVAVTIAIAVASGLYHYYEEKSEQEFLSEYHNLIEKRRVTVDLNHAFNDVFYEARGYILYQQQEKYNEIQNHQKTIDALMNQLETLVGSHEDYLYLSEVHNFYDYYFHDLLIRYLPMIEEESIETVQSLLQEEQVTTEINNFKEILNDYRYQISEIVDSKIQENLDRHSQSRWAFIAFIFLVMLLISLMTRMIFIQFAKPIQELASIAEFVSKGQEIREIKSVEREDEIGVLSKAFQTMLKNIQRNKQELVAQNEELIAQQDELTAQQESLQEALQYKDENEQMLKRRNELVKNLSSTLNRQELLQNVVDNMASVLNADKGMIVLLDHDDYASFGVGQKGVQQFMDHFHESILIRANEKKKPFVIERESLPVEKGYSSEDMMSSDCIIPVLSDTKEVTAIMVFTRIGKRFLSKEIGEFVGLAKPISLSLDKLKSYEEIESQRLLTKEILETVREGVQLVQQDGTIVQSNRQLNHLVGMDCSKEHTNVSEWIEQLTGRVKQEKELYGFMMNSLKESSQNKSSFTYKIRDPKHRVIKVYYEPLYRNDKRTGTVFVHQDITKQYEIDQMKSEFVSTVSHELRTPLSSILGFSEVMLTKELKPERQKKYMTTIYQEAKRLTALINDFLDVQRMESGRQAYDKKYFNIIPILEKVIEVQQVNTNIHQFNIVEKAVHSDILGDKERIYQLFTNVIRNAVKYSPDGGEVTITVREDDNSLYVDVKDEGLGIPKEAIPKLFTKFYRIDNSDRRKIGGTGLGLSIVKEIIKAHDGDVLVQSEEQVGSTFTLRFPAVKDRTMILDETCTQPKHGTVVIIEDDLSLGLLLQNELKDTGFRVVYYSNGQKAVDEIKSLTTKPDAVVIDIMLNDDMNGWEVITSLKKDPHLKNIPIFISSALDEVEQGKTLGISDYLVKPYEPSKLSKSILQTLLQKGQAGQILFPVNKETL